MEHTKPAGNPGQPLSPEQVSSISGGEGDASCPSTVIVGTSGSSVTSSGATPSDALIAIYEGFVDVTSHIIERVMGQ